MKNIIVGLVLAIVVAGLVAFSPASANEEAKSAIVLKKNNTIIFNQEFDDLSVAKATAEAYAMDAQLSKGEPIYLIMNSPGGSIISGLELIANLNALGRKVNTITLFAASMGFQTVQGLGDRLIVSNGTLMSHRGFASGGFSGEFGGKEKSQLTNRYEYWLTKIRTLDEQTVSRTKGKQTLESYQDAYENELWIDGQDAVNAGYADAVVSPRCDKSLSGVRDQVIDYMGMEIVLHFSECPLITGPLGYEVLIVTTQGTKVSLQDFIKLGGQFGNSCVSQNITQLCPKDVTLTLEKIEQMKKEAVNKFKIDRNDVIRGY